MKRSIVWGAALLLIIQNPRSSAQDAPAVTSVVIARPSDASFNNSQPSFWLGALWEQAMHLKMGAMPQLSVYPFDSMFVSIPHYSDLKNDIRRDRYITLCRNRRTQYLITTQYEIQRDKDLMILYEVLSVKENRPVLSVETSVPIANANRLIDSCIALTFKKLQVEPDKGSLLFLRSASFGDNLKVTRQLGTTAISHLYTEESDPSVSAQVYRDLSTRDPGMLAKHLGAKAFAQSNNLIESALLKEKLLLTLGTAYPELYLQCAEHFRAARRFDDALRITLFAERTGISSSEIRSLRARLYLDKGDRERARELFSSIKEEHADDPATLLYFAEQYNREGNPDKALAFTEKLLARKPNYPPGLVERGRALLQLKRIEQAQSDLRRASEAIADNPIPFILLGDIAAGSGRHTDATRNYERALQLIPGDFSLRVKAAESFVKIGTRDKARSLIQPLQSARITDPDLLRRLGLVHFRLGDSTRARERLESYLTFEQKEYDALSALGEIYLSRGENDRALRMFTFALPHAPDKNRARLALARIHVQDSSSSEAIIHLREILAENSRYPAANQLMGDAYLLDGKHDEALRSYEVERRHHGSSEYLQYGIAELRYRTKNWKSAKEEYLALLKFNPPEDKQVYERLATICLELKELSEAKEHLKSAMARGSTNAELLHRFGIAYYELKRYSEAAEVLNQCLVLSPNHVGALEGLALTYVAMRKEASAAAAYVTLGEKTGRGDHLVTASRFYLAAQDTANAERTLEKLLTLEKRPDAVVTLARLKSARGEHRQVVSLLESTPDASPQVSILLAQSHTRIDQHAQALEVVSRIVEKDPTHREAVEIGATAAEKSGDLKSAVTWYERYLSLPASPQHAEFAYRVGDLYEKQDLRTQALRRYERNTKAYPSDPRNFERLGALQLQAGDHKAAVAALRSGVALRGASPEMKVLLAQALVGSKDTKGAVRYYTDYLKTNPNDTAALIQLGSIHFTNKEYILALTPLKRAVDLRAGGTDCFYMIGFAYLQTGKSAEAIGFLKRAREKDPDRVATLSALATAFRSTKNEEGLLSVLPAWADRDTGNYDIQRQAGEILHSSKKEKDAIPYLDRAVRLRPSDASSHVSLARIFRAQGSEEKMIYHYSQAAQHAPTQFEPHFALGEWYRSKQDLGRAQPHYRKAVEIKPADASANFGLGVCLLHQGNQKSALPYLHAAIKTSPDSGRYEYELARAYHATGNSSQALTAIRRASSLSPKDDQVQFWAGVLHFEGKLYDSARRHFKASASANRLCARCFEYLGDIDMLQKKYSSAAQYYDQSARIDKSNASVVSKLGVAWEKAGNPRKALKSFEQVLRIDSTNLEAVYLTGHFHLKSGNPAKARNVLERRQKGHTNSGWITLLSGEIELFSGNTQGALVALISAARMLPQSAAAQTACGLAYLERNDHTAALTYFRRALTLSPGHGPALVGAGLALIGTKEYSGAIDHLRKGIAEGEHSAKVFAGIGSVERARGNHLKAIEAYEKALKVDRQDARLHLALGNEYRALSRYQEAVRAYQSAARKAGEHQKEAYLQMGDIYYAPMKAWDKAKSYYAKYLKAGGNDPKVKRRLERM